jgi:hypothetical protein
MTLNHGTRIKNPISCYCTDDVSNYACCNQISRSSWFCQQSKIQKRPGCSWTSIQVIFLSIICASLLLMSSIKARVFFFLDRRLHFLVCSPSKRLLCHYSHQKWETSSSNFYLKFIIISNNVLDGKNFFSFFSFFFSTKTNYE